MSKSGKDVRELPAQVQSRGHWLDAADLAARYKCSIRHIIRMADAGKMPWGTKLGSLRRWSCLEIENWEKGGCQPVRGGRK